MRVTYNNSIVYKSRNIEWDKIEVVVGSKSRIRGGVKYRLDNVTVNPYHDIAILKVQTLANSIKR